MQSLGAEVFLRIRRSSVLSSLRIVRRLDPHQNSAGELCSYSDAWLKAESTDWAALHKALGGAQGGAVLFIDVWGHLLSSSDILELKQELQRAVGASSHTILLFPRFHAGLVRQLAPDSAANEVVRRAWFRMVDRMQELFEFFLNLTMRCSLVEAPLPEADAVRILQLDFRYLKRWIGIFPVVPGDVASDLVGYGDTKEVCDHVVGALEHFASGSMAPHMVRAQNCFTKLYGGFGQNRRRRFGLCSPLVRRSDGVLALPVGWGRYVQLVDAGESQRMPRARFGLGEGSEGPFPDWVGLSLLAGLLRLDGEAERVTRRTVRPLRTKGMLENDAGEGL